MPTFSLFHIAPNGNTFTDVVNDQATPYLAAMTRINGLLKGDNSRKLLAQPGEHTLQVYQVGHKPVQIHEPMYGPEPVYMFLLVISELSLICRAGISSLEQIQPMNSMLIARLLWLGKIKSPSVAVNALPLTSRSEFKVITNSDEPIVREVYLS